MTSRVIYGCWDSQEIPFGRIIAILILIYNQLLIEISKFNNMKQKSKCTGPKWNNYTMLVTNTYTYQVRCNSSDIRTHNWMDKKVYGIAVFTIIAVLLLWRSERLHRVVNIESGSVAEVHNTGEFTTLVKSTTLVRFTIHCLHRGAAPYRGSLLTAAAARQTPSIGRSRLTFHLTSSPSTVPWVYMRMQKDGSHLSWIYFRSGNGVWVCSSTLQGFTADCCSGSPNTKHWPQQIDVSLTSSPSTVPWVYMRMQKDGSHLSWIYFRSGNGVGVCPIPMSYRRLAGGGSTLSVTALVRQTLDCVINDIKYTLKKKLLRILDVPCGDLRWMSVFLRNRTDVEYTGMDIVPDIIKRHRETYSDKPWTFRVHDIVAEPLTASYDLVFSRDMTQHLTNGDTLRVLHHISTSGSHFAMLSTYPRGSSAPHDDTELDLIRPGRGRPQDLESRPYRLTPPICVGQEKKQRF